MISSSKDVTAFEADILAGLSYKSYRMIVWLTSDWREAMYWNLFDFPQTHVEKSMEQRNTHMMQLYK